MRPKTIRANTPLIPVGRPSMPIEKKQLCATHMQQYEKTDNEYSMMSSTKSIITSILKRGKKYAMHICERVPVPLTRYLTKTKPVSKGSLMFENLLVYFNKKT